MIGDKQTSELLYRVLNTFQDAVVWIDTNSRIVEWNGAAERLFGFMREDVVGCSLAHTIIPDEHRVAHLNGMAKFMQTGAGAIFGRTVDINALTWSGDQIDVAISIDSIVVNNTQYFTAHIRSLEGEKDGEAETTSIGTAVAESGMGDPLALEPKSA